MIEECSTINLTIRIKGFCPNKDYEKVKEIIQEFKNKLEKLNVIIE